MAEPIQKSKAVSFSQLTVWREGHALALIVYRATKRFPKEELFGLTSQMRRAVVSVTSNIAEGFTRKSKLEKINFYYISLSSLHELQNESLIALDVGYLDRKSFDEIASRSVLVAKLLNALIRSIKTSKLSKSPATSY